MIELLCNFVKFCQRKYMRQYQICVCDLLEKDTFVKSGFKDQKF
jgi:hypothetical protein